MSPETIVAQLEPTLTEKMIGDRIANGRRGGSKGFGAAQAWEDTFSAEEFRLVNEKDKTEKINLVLEDNKDKKNDMTGAELQSYLYSVKI